MCSAEAPDPWVERELLHLAVRRVPAQPLPREVQAHGDALHNIILRLGGDDSDVMDFLLAVSSWGFIPPALRRDEQQGRSTQIADPLPGTLGLLASHVAYEQSQASRWEVTHGAEEALSYIA